MSDTYNRTMLTVIAVALVALVIQNFGTQNVDMMPAAHAAGGHRALFVPDNTEGFNALQEQLGKSTPVLMDFGRFNGKDGVLLIYK